ncbi:MAG: M48 family metalloprotease [Cyclobacteriaceae bacterium]|nr:M48 family metalloprotease [Cyclobacteriaceae bacterium]
MKKTLILILISGLMPWFHSCDKNENLNLFSTEDDLTLGHQVAQQIASDPATFPILDRNDYAEAYAYMNQLVDRILNSGEVVYRDEFVWDVHIINDDSILNAFAAPGGYIYVYTGLIKYLDAEDHFVGILGHEIAHADLRHASRQLQAQYGISFLLSLLIGGDPGALEQIAGQIAGTLTGLKYSREYEREADARSVRYLAETVYACNGAAGFFSKIESEGKCNANIVWLSTHPDPCQRIESINEMAAEIQCSTDDLDPPSYRDFIALLP